MASTKAIEFIGSSEYFEIIKKIGDLFNISWGDKRMPKIIALINDILRYNQISETPVKELIKKWLDFLNEEEVNKLYNFLEENFLPKVRELWQEEETQESVVVEEVEEETQESVEKEEAQEESFEETEEESEEKSFEEREKRYIELMETIIQYPQRPKQEKIDEKPKKKEEEETKEEVEEYKTITFEPKEEHKKETKKESLPETTIVITKKKEEEKPKEGEEFLDLSKL
jgi:hypothetical protein